MLAIACSVVSARAVSPRASGSLSVSGWYVGAEGGVPFAVSTFSSFADGNVRAGWGAGVFFGHAFSRSVSLEAQAAWGRAWLGARPCCTSTGYWLGSDGSMYYAPVDGLDGWDYRSLKSHVAVQGYGLQLNLNVLPWLGAPPQGRWNLDVSPRLAAVGTKAKLYETATGACVSSQPVRWHFAAGFRLQCGYDVARRLKLGLYTGMTFLTGSRMDGIPRHAHSSNYLWESGLRISFSFGRAKRKAAEQPRTVPQVPLQPALRPEPVAERSVQTVTELPKDTPKPTKPKAEKAVFPVIYFNFNSTAIRPSERAKVDTLARMMAADPLMRVRLTGWADQRGTPEVNFRVSLRRAEAVKRLLVSLGIDAWRIETDGKGTDHGQAEAARARRVVAIKIVEEGS